MKVILNRFWARFLSPWLGLSQVTKLAIIATLVLAVLVAGLLTLEFNKITFFSVQTEEAENSQLKLDLMEASNELIETRNKVERLKKQLCDQDEERYSELCGQNSGEE